jgi:hypothetical protein
MADVEGRVEKIRLNVGSRSERDTIVLRTGDQDYLVLRRPGGNPWQDDVLESLVGRDVRCHGNISDGLLHMTQFEDVSRSDASDAKTDHDLPGTEPGTSRSTPGRE